MHQADRVCKLITVTGLWANVYDSRVRYSYYNRARYLNTGTGRFFTQDSFEGNQYDPRSLHKYLYAANNPINLLDPSGLAFSLADIGFALTIAGIIVNSAQAIYHIHNALQAKDRVTQIAETTAAVINTLGVFFSVIGGGFIGPLGSAAATNGVTIPVVIASYKVVLDSIVIPLGVTIGTLIFSKPPGGSGGSSGSGSSSSGPNVDTNDDNHIDDPKHNLNRLAPTYAQQKALLIDAVKRMLRVAPQGAPSPSGGSFIEGTTVIDSTTGQSVTTTIRWYEDPSGNNVKISTAFCP